MAITKTTTIDNVGYDLDGRGDIAVRIAKCTWNDGVLVEREPHRFVIEAGDDIEAEIARHNARLSELGFPSVPADDIADIKAQAERRWTPVRVKAREDRDTKAREEFAREQKAEEEHKAAEREQTEKDATIASKAEEDRVRALFTRIAAEERAKV